MQGALFVFGFGIVASTLAHSIEQSCKEINIPITVSVPRFELDTKIESDWDAAALTLNLTRQDFTTANDPLPVIGFTSPIDSTYTVGATLCGTGGTLLVLTHGIIESKLYVRERSIAVPKYFTDYYRYWRPNLVDTDQYNFVDAALKAGYSILSYDRIGVGSSAKGVILVRHKLSVY